MQSSVGGVQSVGSLQRLVEAVGATGQHVRRARRSRLSWPAVLLLGAVVVFLSGGVAAFAIQASGSVRGSAATAGVSELATVSEPADRPIDTRETSGFRVERFRSDESVSGRLVVLYRITVNDPHGFGDMLGVPRIANPDGTLALPREYGAVAGKAEFQGAIAGLPDSAMGAIFSAADVAPGAVVRFGPFFRSSDEGVTIRTTGAALAKGHTQTIGGEPFTIGATANADGSTTIDLVNTAANATVVASHPGSTVTVTIDGNPAEIIRGSTNFAKTVGYEVNANRSAIIIAGRIPDGAAVLITVSSIGEVYRGSWDFPLN